MSLYKLSSYWPIPPRRRLLSSAAFPGLAQFGIKSADFVEIIDAARRANNMKYNPIALSDQQLSEILSNAL